MEARGGGSGRSSGISSDLVEGIAESLYFSWSKEFRCTTAKQRRIIRCEHEPLIEEFQARLNAHPERKRQRRKTVEHPFGTIKARKGATHFLTRTLPRVRTEMALHVLAYNLSRAINILGTGPLIAAIRT